MKKKMVNTRIILDEVAEGTRESDHMREPVQVVQTMTFPAIRVEVDDAPASETGVIRIVRMEAEGSDNNDAQDASDQDAQTQTAPEQKNDPIAQKMPSVLIVEDTAELAEVIQATLERMNLRTAHESHGDKALRRYQEMQPDVVLLDIGLPDTNGWKLLEDIRHDYEKKEKKPIIIVITAYGDAANRLVGKLQNVYSYLVKPFTPDQVEQIVAQALGRSAG